MRVRDVELGGSGEDSEEAPGMVACLGKEQRARGRVKISKQTGVKHHSGSISTLAARVKAQQLVPRGGLEAISPQRLSGLRRGTHARRALSARGERKSQVAGDDEEDIDVIQKDEEDLPWQHRLCGLQNWVLRERKQARQGVALFAPFALLDDMRRAVVVVPQVL